MSINPRRDTRWWGWGDPDELATLPDGAEAMLAERGIPLGEVVAVPSVEQVSLPDAQPLPDVIRRLFDEESMFTGAEDRLRHAAGQSYLDLIEKRSGTIQNAPDAVIVPARAEQVLPLLEACSQKGIAVVPFGGGTSVVGGIAPLSGKFDRVISLDTSAFRSVEIDSRSLTARLGAGLRGPEAEAALAAEGFTIGHFPQSFEYATIGGFAATRSAGQSSSGYGRFDSLVSSIRMIAPAGEISTLDTPHSSIGPSLRELIVGSEGAFGVIPEVQVRIRPVPVSKRYEAWMAGSFTEATEIIRGLAQGDALPTVARVSDEDESEVNLSLSLPSGAAGRMFRRYLAMRGRAGGCLVIAGFEGDSDSVRVSRAATARSLRKGGAVYLGQAAGSGWAKGRFHGPYLREALLDRGVLVETLETAQQWSHHGDLYRSVGAAVRKAMKSRGMEGIVMCHLSHAYRDGASLYFTVIASQGPGGGATNWPFVKAAAMGAIQSCGGTLSHHHATGRDHARYLPGEVGDLGVDALQALKAEFDPEGIMNPGKLLP